MLEQAIDFRGESEALFDLLDPIKDENFEPQTLFKGQALVHRGLQVPEKIPGLKPGAPLGARHIETQE